MSKNFKITRNYEKILKFYSNWCYLRRHLWQTPSSGNFRLHLKLTLIFRFSPDFLWNCGPGGLFRQQFGHFGGHLQQTNEKHDQFTDLELGGCGCAFYCFLRPFYGHFLRFATLLAIWRTLVSLIAYFRSFYVIFGVYDIASSFSQLFILIIIHQVYHNTCPIHLKSFVMYVRDIAH